MARTANATLGGGCFWCLDAVYRQLDGIRSSTCGYAGGHTPDPTYESVCGGRTGHAEVVQIQFDPTVISYREILEVFYTIHDPTTPDQQGADVGSQYRSIILAHNEEQEREAWQIMEELEREKVYARRIVTEVQRLKKFWVAEDHHQDYFAQNPGQGYCQAVIAPKLEKFRKRWQARLRA